MSGELKRINGSTTTAVSIAANMTNGQVAGNNVGGIVDNSSLAYPYGEAVLYVNGFSVAPTANLFIELWAVAQDIDGTADATAGSGVTSAPATPSAGFVSTDGAEWVGNFPLANTVSAQRVRLTFDFPCLKASFFIRNQSGQTVTAGVGTECTVKVTPFSIAPAP